MTPEELSLLTSINNNLELIVNKIGAIDSKSEPELETESSNSEAELLLEGE